MPEALRLFCSGLRTDAFGSILRFARLSHIDGNFEAINIETLKTEAEEAKTDKEGAEE